MDGQQNIKKKRTSCYSDTNMAALINPLKPNGYIMYPTRYGVKKLYSLPLKCISAIFTDLTTISYYIKNHSVKPYSPTRCSEKLQTQPKHTHTHTHKHIRGAD